MGEKTSHRRKHQKIRDPLAESSDEPQMHIPRRVTPSRRKRRKGEDDPE